MFTTLRNAWKIEDLRKRILFTLLVLLLFRLGAAVPVPFIQKDVLANWVANSTSGGTTNMMSYLDMLTGGSFSQATVFALSVTPYINASIIIQLLAVAIPALERLAREGDEGQRKMNRITRYVGAGIALALSIAYFALLRNQGALIYTSGFDGVFSAIVIILTFTAGSMLIQWMGEQIDSKGIGNGISLLIFAGIVSRMSTLISSTASYFQLASGGQTSYYYSVPLVGLFILASIVFVIFLTGAERRIPVVYAKKVVGRKQYGGQSTHIPIKVNMSGVMPIIFASSLMSIPGTILTFFPGIQAKNGFWYHFLSFFNYSSLGYALIYALLIIGFNYFYVAIQYNPIEIANNLRKNNGGIPGIRPGKPTSDFISKALGKVTFVGAIFLALIAVLPILVGNVTHVRVQLAGTSLLILVGVALDTCRSLESFMLMRHHKGFLE